MTGQPSPIVADAGPLIGLARIERLDLVRELFGGVVVPTAVADELHLRSHRPGAQDLSWAMASGWL